MPTKGALSLAHGSFEALPGIFSGAAWVRRVCSPAAQAVVRSVIARSLRPRAPRPRLRLRGQPGRGRGGRLGAGPRAACLATPGPPTPPCSSGTSPTPPGEPRRDPARVRAGAAGCLGAGWAVGCLAVGCWPGTPVLSCRLSECQPGVRVPVGGWGAGLVSGHRTTGCRGVGVLTGCCRDVRMLAGCRGAGCGGSDGPGLVVTASCRRRPLTFRRNWGCLISGCVP